MNLFQHLGPRPKRSSHKVKSTRVHREKPPSLLVDLADLAHVWEWLASLQPLGRGVPGLIPHPPVFPPPIWCLPSVYCAIGPQLSLNYTYVLDETSLLRNVCVGSAPRFSLRRTKSLEKCSVYQDAI